MSKYVCSSCGKSGDDPTGWHIGHDGEDFCSSECLDSRSQESREDHHSLTAETLAAESELDDRRDESSDDA